jgi:hypothetical protein
MKKWLAVLSEIKECFTGECGLGRLVAALAGFGYGGYWIVVILASGCDQEQPRQVDAFDEARWKNKALILTDHLGNRYAAFYRHDEMWELRPVVAPRPAMIISVTNSTTNLVIRAEDP